MDPTPLAEIVRAVGASFEGRGPGPPVTGASIDSRHVKAGDLFFALPGSRTDGSRFVTDAFRRGASGAVVAREAKRVGSRGPRDRILRVDRPARALWDLAAFHRRNLDLPVVAVTGSCGKTTTREILHALLAAALGTGVRSRKSFNNALGVPLTLLEVDRRHAFVVVEMGANHPGEIRDLAALARPRIGLITNVRKAHLEGFSDLFGVARAKGELFEELGPRDLAVYNPAELGLNAIARRERLATLTFGAGSRCAVRIESAAETPEGLSVRINGVGFLVPLVGVRMAWNVAAAAAVGLALGVSLEQGSEALRRFRAPPGRLTSRRFAGLTLIDDAYNANPASMRAALEALRARTRAKRRVLVLGDMLELGKASLRCHMELGRQAAAVGPDLTIPVGRRISATVGAMVARGVDCSTIHPFEDAEAAVEAVPGLLREGDVVLLKASRALRFERILEAIESRFPSRSEKQTV
ncbi:MAG: UDP-N-acetylmuramoyl-tripeptide--D-alanyl-D-alanine ligase [Planctomycetota bacterium]|jgi:UDP-N-acetylmuramoyl-tripeptide--D-alanyl-D-alanine ligase